MIVCAGGCGCRTAARLDVDAEIVCLGSKADLVEADGGKKVVLDIGSATGAHRDHRRAFAQLQRNAKKMRKITQVAAKLFKNEQRCPVIVYGLCGATGLSVAKSFLLTKIPQVHVVAYPHPNEPEAAQAPDKLRFLLDGRKSEVVLRAWTPVKPRDAETLARMAQDVRQVLDERLVHPDTINQYSKRDIHWINGNQANVGDLFKLAESVAAQAPDKTSVRSVNVRASRRGASVDEELKDVAEDEEDFDPFDIF